MRGYRLMEIHISDVMGTDQGPGNIAGIDLSSTYSCILWITMQIPRFVFALK